MASILIVDDEAILRMTIRKILERSGHEVFEAKDGMAGSDFYRDHPTDIVLTDIVMPNKDGIQLIAELKRDCPRVRFIAMSGGGRASDLDFLTLAKEFGAERILNKPFSRNDLVEAVRSILATPEHLYA